MPGKRCSRRTAARRGPAVVLAAGALAVLATACSSGGGTSSSDGGAKPASLSGASSTTKISFGFSNPGVGDMPLLVAQSEGFFAKQHLDVSFQSFNGGGSTVSAALASGALQGDKGGLEFLDSNAKNVTKAVAVAQVAGSNYEIFAKKGITSASQLKGKTLGVGSLSGADYVWWQIALPAFGVPASSVHFVVISGSSSAKFAALDNGAVDAVVSFAGNEPSDAPQPLTTPTQAPQQPQLIMFDKSFIQAHPTAVNGFVKALSDSVAWIKSNVPAAQKVCESKLDDSAAQCSFKSDLHSKNPYTWSKTGAVDVQSIKKQFPELKTLYSEMTPSTIDSFVDTSFAGTSPQ
jgi:NitT/TauT family transport system substrate-binding protein